MLFIKKKSPSSNYELGDIPFLSANISIQQPFSTKASYVHVTDRSSGFRIILLAAPSLPAFAGQWHQLRRSSPITAAGPLPICTGFTIKPLRASCNISNQSYFLEPLLKNYIGNVKKNFSAILILERSMRHFLQAYHISLMFKGKLPMIRGEVLISTSFPREGKQSRVFSFHRHYGRSCGPKPLCLGDSLKARGKRFQCGVPETLRNRSCQLGWSLDGSGCFSV